MKLKLSYVVIPVFMFLVAIGLFSGQTAEATSNSSTWSQIPSTSTGIQRTTEIENNILTAEQPAARVFGAFGSGGIQVTKYDSKTNARLAGAEFTIYDAWNRPVQVIQSNVNGIAQTMTLPLGNYSIKETKAPNGYQIESSPMYFSLMRNGQVVCFTKCNVPLPNDRGGIQVIKTNEANQILAGAVFDVYNSSNQFVGRVTTGVNGTALLTDLPFGTYKFIEVQAPVGYELDSTPRYVTISETKKNATLFVTNKKSTGSLQVIKTDQAGKLLPNAYFQVYNSSNQLVKTIVTDANGLATVGNLPYDIYRLVEIQAPNGYELDATPHYVTISKDNPNGVASITVVNKKKVTTGDLEVVKKDEAGTVLAGAQFTVYNTNNQVVGTITTDANGIATLKGLPFGIYRLVETKAPAGYELDATPKYITVAESDPNGKVSITIVNKKEQTTGDLEVIKKDETGALLAGAEFELYNSADQLVNKLTTDANGVATLTDLPYGVYKLIETKAPEGYEMDATPKYVTISKTDPNGKATVEVLNKKVIVPETGALKIIKYVKGSDPIEYLADAVFEVYDTDTQLLGTFTTDQNGEILLSDLAPGKYYAIEVKAPPGFEEDTTFYEVVVEAGKTTEIRHANIKQENLGGLKITKYAKDDDGFETENVLPNAEFSVLDSKGNTHTGITDINGEIFFPNLPIGEVVITETKAPDGYEIDNAVQVQTIEVGTIAENVFYNKPKLTPGRALVYVSSSDAKQALGGLEYTITCKKGNMLDTVAATNSFGQISIYLPPGEYEIFPFTVGRTSSTIKPTSFTIESNKFTIIKLKI